MLSPKSRGRLAGLFELLEGFPSVFGQVGVLGIVVVHGNASATAQNILAHQALYRAGFAIPMVSIGFQIIWALLLYQLLRPVHRTIAQVALLVILISCGIHAIAGLAYIEPLVILQTAGAAPPPVQQELALSFISLSTQAYDLGLVFFGFWIALTGYLIARSRFLPRVLGLLLILDGIGWMLYLWSPLATYLFPVIAVVAGLAEWPLVLWFLIFSVNERRWYEQAALAGEDWGMRTDTSDHMPRTQTS